MLWFGVIRVNDQSQFTFAKLTGEFKLYVNPEQPCRTLGDDGGADEGEEFAAKAAQPSG